MARGQVGRGAPKLVARRQADRLALLDVPAAQGEVVARRLAHDEDGHAQPQHLGVDGLQQRVRGQLGDVVLELAPVRLVHDAGRLQLRHDAPLEGRVVQGLEEEPAGRGDGVGVGPGAAV